MERATESTYSDIDDPERQLSTSESSWEQDLIQSVGSSFSVTDESDGEATHLLRDQLKKFEAALYEDGPIDGLLGDALEETKQWSRFPHLRIIGKAIDLKARDTENEAKGDKQEVSDEDDSSTISEASSDGGTFRDRSEWSDCRDGSSEEEFWQSSRRKRIGSDKWSRACSNTSAAGLSRSWYPIQVQNWIPEEILPRQPRLSPIPYETRASSHYNHQRSIQGYDPHPSIMRHGTLPPIETLEITSKPLLNRCKSARLGSGCPPSRPTTSRKPIVLSPICGRSSSMKKHSPKKGPPKDNFSSELKPLKNTKPTVIWKY